MFLYAVYVAYWIILVSLVFHYEKKIEELEEEQYATPLSADLSAIAINRKCFKQCAQPDMDRAAALLLDDFRNGRLGKLSLERPKA